jgi:hypothetical protein
MNKLYKEQFEKIAADLDRIGSKTRVAMFLGGTCGQETIITLHAAVVWAHTAAVSMAALASEPGDAAADGLIGATLEPLESVTRRIATINVARLQIDDDYAGRRMRHAQVQEQCAMALLDLQYAVKRFIGTGKDFIHAVEN